MELLEEEFRINGITLAHIGRLNPNDDKNKDDFVDFKRKCIYHVNLGECCSKAELWALIVYLDDCRL